MKLTKSWIKVLTLVLVITSLLSRPGDVSTTTIPSPEAVPATPTITSTPSAETRILYQVEKVVDGDTLKVTIDGKIETLRLIGLDTPEVVDPRKPVQCFGIEASNKAKEILTDQKVALEADLSQGNRDKYGRLLRYVYLENGENFNKMMIAEGYGHQYTYNKPYKYMDEFKLAEQKARSEKKGLWGDGVCL